MYFVVCYEYFERPPPSYHFPFPCFSTTLHVSLVELSRISIYFFQKMEFEMLFKSVVYNLELLPVAIE